MCGMLNFQLVYIIYSYDEAKKQSISPWFDQDKNFNSRSDSVEILNADIDNFLESL